MMRRHSAFFLLASVLAGVCIFAGGLARAAEFDPSTGLKISAGWDLVRSNCIACHSSKLITQQRASAAQWLTMIRWMQAKQNLWQLEPEVEDRIVAYLAANYPPQQDRRRAPLSPDLMPPNPYSPGQQTR
jgi:mono/diheme cytochrome c family protein